MQPCDEMLVELWHTCFAITYYYYFFFLSSRESHLDDIECHMLLLLTKVVVIEGRNVCLVKPNFNLNRGFICFGWPKDI